MAMKINTKTLAYNLRVKQKRHKKYLNAHRIFYLLRDISNLDYDRTSGRSRYKKVGDCFLSLDMGKGDFPKNLDEKIGLKINFILGKERDETFPTRNPEGEYKQSNLPKGENLCFKTHGSFIFKKLTNQWCCILVIERRHHTTGLSRLIKYLQKFNADFTIESDVICRPIDVFKKIKSISEIKSVVMRNQDISFSKNAGMGTILAEDSENKKYEETRIQFKIAHGNSPMEQIKNLFIDYVKNKKDFEKGNLTKFAVDTELALVNQNNQVINLYEDLALYYFDVDALKTREINSSDFFVKLGNILTKVELDKLLNLSRKFYDSIEIEDTLNNSQETEDTES